MEANPVLLPYLYRNTWITAKPSTFRAQFKALCFKMSSVWDARVRSDADLLDAWLGTAKISGAKIYDVEVEESTSIKALDIPSLVNGFPLVAIVTGVKRLPNRECANALLEAIGYRMHDNLPVWIVDQPENPISDMSHQFFSDALNDRMAEWPHVVLRANGSIEQEGEAEQPVPVEVEKKIAAIVATDLEDMPPPTPKRSKREPVQSDTEELIPGLRLEPTKKRKGKFR